MKSSLEGLPCNLISFIGSNTVDESSSLELLKKTILFSGGPNHLIRENSKMDTWAIEMVKMYGGVRVAMTILGGILGRKHEIEEWESITSVLKEGNDVVTSLLELSYEDLPCHLKPRFLHFSQYARDEEIKTSEIIQRWIGEGVVMEDIVGHEHLNELVSRGLIQVGGKRSHRGRATTCSMHEFVWHFCVSKAKEEGFALSLHQHDEGTILEKVKFCRLCVYPGGISYNFGGSITPSSLVEIIPQLVSVSFQYPQGLYINYEQAKAAILIVKNLKSVKVLSLPGRVWSLLDQSGREHIGNLVELTFLKLEGLSELPKSLGNLRCLQTLNLKTCGPHTTIPDSVWGMRQLRHLYLPREGSVCESCPPPVASFLHLQTLVNFPPRNYDLERDLWQFRNVSKLGIKARRIDMDEILSGKEILCRDVVNFQAISRGCPRLYRLTVEGLLRLPAASSCTAIWPSNLIKLVLRCTYIDQSRLGSLAKLQSLQVLFLQHDSFVGKEMILHRNGFPQLHHLKISGLKHLETCAVLGGALSNLVCLEIQNCWNLESVPDGIQYLKQLEDLKVKNMSYTFTDRLERGGEDWDRVSHVPSISISEKGCNTLT